MEAELMRDEHAPERGTVLDRGQGFGTGALAAFCLWGGSRVVANGSPDRRSGIWRATSLYAVVQNPESIETVSPWSPPLWGSREATPKVCLTFSPPLDLLSTEPRQLMGRL